MSLSGVRALAFDVFGTVVDWRSTIIEEGGRLNREKGLDVDWAAFADAWREEYRPSMDRVRRGELPWTKLDDLHRASLEKLLDEFGVEGLNDAEKERLNRVWHRLKPWPDAVEGLKRLRRRYILATLSNGNVALLVNMAKRAGLPWDCVLSAELARRYKPDREVYLMAAELLGLKAGEVGMVAAHAEDLLAARQAGLRTVFVPRPLEFGPGGAAEAPDPSFDMVVEDLTDLARRLGL
ncbi:haloacid dehalogenase type II [Rubrobacter taiwanensis]|jgi:2-haloacid dehalogenase|uniref:Haloacid dehalogenase type II n=1 Tax=Rubrobacter taiwanensis TaxID=185139 RepID=A0A4R1BPX9_9ACTN|nr:haloacid dehalogenase type II [Rubrobacter taiwanensis]TCJ19694.1 haloacid dehalogenase type II [Rubrobacter taiwanensis]